MSSQASTAPPRPTYLAIVARLGAAQKTVKGAPAYSRFVNRRAGRYLAAAAYLVGATPNQVTAVSATFSFIGIAVLALVEPSAATGVVVCLALVVGYAFDAADGQLARLRGGGSPAGEWLDHVVDCAKISSLHLAVAVSLFRFSDLGRGPYLLVPLGYAVVGAVAFFGMTLNDLLRRANREASAPPPPIVASAPVGRSLLVLPTDYGFLCLIFLLLGAGAAFPVAYGLVALANAMFLAATLVKWYRDMTRLGGLE